MKITGIVLAGGKSSRFGEDKALAMFQGKMMLKHSVDLLSGFCDKILISGNKDEYKEFASKLVPDKYPYSGPIGGVISALETSDTEYNIVVTCDMPLITPRIIKQLINSINDGAVIVYSNELKEKYPFPGVYPKSVIKKLIDALSDSKTEMKEVLPSLEHKTLLYEGRDKTCFANINEKQQLIVLENSGSAAK